MILIPTMSSRRVSHSNDESSKSYQILILMIIHVNFEWYLGPLSIYQIFYQ